MHPAPLLAAAVVAAGWALHAAWLIRRLHAVRRDPITGLLTHAGWSRRARRIIRRRHAAVIMLDLDGFKPVNDTYGHAAGNAVLAAVAGRLAAWCGPHGVAGRLGGDEFAAALPDDESLAQRVAELHRTLCRPIDIGGGHSVSVGASIGAVRLVDLPEPGLSPAMALADAAMYAHKGRGRRGRPLDAPDRARTAAAGLAHAS